MSSRHHLLRASGLAALVALMAACTTTTRGFQAADAEVNRPQAGARILLMPPDVELAEVTAAGLEEPRADWTELGTNNLLAALEANLGLREARMIEYRAPADSIARIRPEHVQLVKLHGAVGGSILVHKYDPSGTAGLPTKQGRFDWTIGDGARRLREDHDADYALFVYFRDTQASTGRAAVQAIGILMGVGVRGGYEVGFASLVDLDGGDIVWFNVLSGTGRDIRQVADAEAAVEDLLEEIPIGSTSSEVTQQRVQEQQQDQAGKQDDGTGQNLTDCPTGRGSGC